MGKRNFNSIDNDPSNLSRFLERARKLEQLICERGCLEEKLSHLIRSLTPLKNLHRTLEEIIRHVVTIYGASVVRLWLLELGGERVHLEAQCGEALPGKVTELASKGIVGEIVRTRTYLFSPEVLKSPYLQDKDWVIKNQLITHLGFPLIAEGELLGVLTTAYKSFRPFSEEEIKWFSFIADVAAIAIRNAFLHEEIRAESIRDPLTGAYNRRYLFERLVEEILRSKRSGFPLALLHCDLNRFKLANDLYGHSVGDKILKAVCLILTEALRRTDILCRYGGDEFVIVLPETDLEGALVAASNINKTLSERVPENIQAIDFPLELSIGIAVYPFEGDSPDELISMADHACYRAKSESGHIYPPSRDYSGDRPIDLPSIFFNTLATAIDMKDMHTHGHSYIVAQLAIMLAHKLGLSSQQIRDIRIAATMHDIGKITVPDSILGKPDKLTQEEWVVMKGHVEAGLEILKKIPGTERILPIVAVVHENYDGSGYPKGLSRHDIPIEARIIAVVDTYQALISKRPYRTAKSHDKALEIIRASYGRQLDPKVASIFVEMMSNRAIK